MKRAEVGFDYRGRIRLFGFVLRSLLLPWRDATMTLYEDRIRWRCGPFKSCNRKTAWRPPR